METTVEALTLAMKAGTSWRASSLAACRENPRAQPWAAGVMPKVCLASCGWFFEPDPTSYFIHTPRIPVAEEKVDNSSVLGVFMWLIIVQTSLVSALLSLLWMKAW